MARSAAAVFLSVAALGFLVGLLIVRQDVKPTKAVELFELRALRPQQLLRISQLDDPAWLGFRSSIDGFNVHQNPSTGPGGAQDHQDPVAYPYPWAGSTNAIGSPTLGGGSMNAQGKSLRKVQLEEEYPYSAPAAWDSDPKHGFGGYGGGTNAGAYEANPGGSYYCADCTW
eukprot:CAMPEP_0181318720 /NCGR_PEP_ID=MMETSP1101-20121128/17161_1 /TAXON_ID=46948 /ORGANISM="Rhodomonas abbreviata, Strain Caron Lab Isolate" /LENGTH=170 /DNA_ID=CAMNT_0023426217 /DNA_START=12 /DNA_END=524 /DNA_ORIENTATION=+